MGVNPQSCKQVSLLLLGGTRRSKAESVYSPPLIAPLRASLRPVLRCCYRRWGLALCPSLLAYARCGWCFSFPYVLYY